MFDYFIFDSKLIIFYIELNCSVFRNIWSENMDNTEQLEKLKALNDKGVLTDEEFNKQKQDLLNNLNNGVSASTPDSFDVRKIGKIIGAIASVVILLSFCSSVEFGCNQGTMKEAEKLVQQLEPKIKFSNPVVVEEHENYKKCKVNTNLKEIPTMYYEIRDQSDGISIEVNPIGDAFEHLGKELEKGLMEIFSDD